MDDVGLGQGSLFQTKISQYQLNTRPSRSINIWLAALITTGKNMYVQPWILKEKTLMPETAAVLQLLIRQVVLISAGGVSIVFFRWDFHQWEGVLEL